MGTASLVFGIILIVIGIVFGFSGFIMSPFIIEDAGIFRATMNISILTVPWFVVGGLLLWKFNRDKKKKD